ncbi:hypothetical protein PENTCL1PPCAC_14855, partial [Pristionchus entomophagus]
MPAESSDWCDAERGTNFGLGPAAEESNAKIATTFFNAIRGENEQFKRESEQAEAYLEKVFAAKYPAERDIIRSEINASTWSAEPGATAPPDTWPFGMFAPQPFPEAISSAVHLIVSANDMWRPILQEVAKELNIAKDMNIFATQKTTINKIFVDEQKEHWTENNCIPSQPPSGTRSDSSRNPSVSLCTSVPK